MAIVMVLNHGEHKGVSMIDDRCVVQTQAEVDKMMANCGKYYAESELQKYYQRKQAEASLPHTDEQK